MVGGGAVRRGECFAAGNPEIAPVLVAQLAKPIDHHFQIVMRRDDQDQVDDRLGREASYGGTADVFDAQHMGADGGRDSVSKMLEDARPLRVIVVDLDASNTLGGHLLS